MKRTLKWLLPVLLFCGFSNSVSAQTLKDFFNSSETPLVYLGVDYTKARLINDPGANSLDIKERLFNSINNVVVDEMSKNYDIAGAFQKSNVTTDISGVTAHNAKINADDIKSSKPEDYSRLTESDIASVVKGINVSGKSGIGLVFVMEGMKKEEKKSYGSVWVTLIDLKTKKVLMTERMEAEAAGFGFRNFWASIIKKTIVAIDKKKYKEWKNKYGA